MNMTTEEVIDFLHCWDGATESRIHQYVEYVSTIDPDSVLDFAEMLPHGWRNIYELRQMIITMLKSTPLS